MHASQMESANGLEARVEVYTDGAPGRRLATTIVRIRERFSRRVVSEEWGEAAQAPAAPATTGAEWWRVSEQAGDQRAADGGGSAGGEDS